MPEGPFDKFLGPWDKMRQSEGFEDRRDDPWPWHSFATPQRERDALTPTDETVMNRIEGILPPDIPPMTRLGRDLGAQDVGKIEPQELLKFLINIDALNAQTERVPLPRPRPQGVK